MSTCQLSGAPKVSRGTATPGVNNPMNTINYAYLMMSKVGIEAQDIRSKKM